MLFVDAEGDIDIEVFDNALNSLGISESIDDNEQVIVIDTAAPGIHYLAVELFSDAGTVPGNDYSIDVAITPEPCVDDGSEDNDTDATATAAALGNNPNLAICDADDDWYAIEGVLIGDDLDILVSFLDDEGDIDAQLYDPTVAQIDAGASVDDNETLSAVDVAAAGTYYVKVELFSDAGIVAGNSYELDVTLTPEPCAEDGFEDNDTDAAATAVVPGAYPALQSCDADSDWFVIATTFAGDDLTIDATFLDDEGDIDIELFDSALNSIDLGDTVTDNEQAEGINLALGTYFVEVTMFSDAGSVAGNSYDLTVTQLIDPCFADDVLEDNDTDADATAMGYETLNNLASCDSDDDWFAIDAFAGDEVTVTVTFSNAEGDIDASLQDAGLATLAAGASTDDDEVFTGTIEESGTHLINVTLFSDAGSIVGNNYDLTVSLACFVDEWEENDTDAAAADIPSRYLTGRICGADDDDWYAIDLQIGDIIDVDAYFSDDEGDLDLHIFDPSLTSLDDSTSVDDDESASATAATAGTHYIEVQNFSDAGTVFGNGYDLDVITTLVAPNCVDFFEANDTDATASSVDTTTDLFSLGLCPTTDVFDWFVFTTTEETDIVVEAFFSDAEGDIDLHLFDGSLSSLDDSQTVDDDELVSATAQPAGTYYVEVEFWLEAGSFTGNTYDLSILAE